MASPYWRARRDNPTQEDLIARVQAGVSPNYKGNPNLVRNRPANIPPTENSSVWLNGLPADVSIYEVLAAVRNTGRVYATVIRRPTLRFPTSGAKITFFTAAAAQALVRRYDGQGASRLIIRNHNVLVRFDRNAVAEATEPADHTRVLIIYGRKEVVNVEFLSNYFKNTMVYEIDEVVPLALGECINMLEWRFGSYRCQAEWARGNLLGDAIFDGHEVSVRFGRDPCGI